MVTATLIRDETAFRWPVYLLAASFALLVLAGLVEFSKPVPSLQVPKILKVSLRTLAARKPVEVQPQPVVSAPKPQKMLTPQVVTKKQAVKKIQKIQHVQKKVEPRVSKPKPAMAKKQIEPPKKPKPVLKEKATPPKEIVEKAPAPQSKKVKAPSVKLGTSEATVIKNPQYRRQTAPVYPRRSYELGQQGIVLLNVEVNANGRARTLKVFKTSGHRRLDMAALSAVKKWEFETNRQTMWVRVPVRFVIN